MFWDSSAVVPLLLPEARSTAITSLASSGEPLVLWWASPVECESALYRRHREAGLAVLQLDEALLRLRALTDAADFITPTNRVRDRAGRVLAAHALRAGNALQLAAALVWCDESPRGERFVCLDERLRQAARREGFDLLP